MAANYYGNPALARAAADHNIAEMQAQASMANAAQAAGANRYGSAVGAAAPFAQAYGQIGSSWASPYSTLAPSLANAYGTMGDGLGQIGTAMGQERASLFNAYAGMAGQLPGAMANAYGSYAAGTAGLAPSMANIYGQYTSGIGGLAQAQAGERTGTRQAVASMAPSLANSYGQYASGLGSLAQAQANQQTAMQGAFSQGVSGIAGSRNAALANSNSAYQSGMAGLGGAQANAYGSYAQGLAGLNNAASGALGGAASGLAGLGTADASAFGARAASSGSLANALAGMYGTQSAGLANLGLANANALGSVANSASGLGAANANAFGARASAGAALGAANSNALNAFSQGASNLASADAQERSGLFNSYSSALANLATTDANERSNMAGAAAQAEAARQLAMGNIGTASLGAYGSAANSALAAWAAQQQAYNKAMSDTAVANQAALGSSSGGRNAALANLGASYAGLAGQGATASVQPDVQFSMGGLGGPGSGSFSASGPGGLVSSGAFSDSGISGGGMSGSKTTDTSQIGSLSSPGFSGLDAARRDVAGGDQTMTGTYLDAANRLDRSNAAAFGMPQETLAQVLSGLTTLGDQSLSGSGRGMDQFYASQAARQPTSDMARDALSRRYDDASARAGSGGILAALRQGFDATRSANSATDNDLSLGLRDTQAANLGLDAATGMRFSDVMAANRGLADGSIASGAAGFGSVLGLGDQLGADYDRQRYSSAQLRDTLGGMFGSTLSQVGRDSSRLASGARATRGALSGIGGQMGDALARSNAAISDDERYIDAMRAQAASSQTPFGSYANMLGQGFGDTLGGIGDLRSDIVGMGDAPYADYAAMMGSGFGGAMGGINSLRGDLGAGFGATAGNIRGLGRDFADQYNNASGRVDYSSVLNPLIDGFGQTRRDINNLPSVFGQGMNQAQSPLGGLWNDTRDIVWNNPAVAERMRREGLQERQRTDEWQKSQQAPRKPPKKYDRSKVIPVGGWKPVSR